MNEKKPGLSSQRVSFDELILEFTKRTEAGESLSPEAFIAANAEHEADLKVYFASFGSGGHAQTEPAGLTETLIGPSEGSADDPTAETLLCAAGDSETSISQNLQHVSRGSDTNFKIRKTFGRYAIRKVLGQGAMGAVYLARDTQLDRDVALKIPKFGDHNDVPDEELLARFYREARASATIRSLNVCPVYDVGEIDGQHYITMAFIEGRPLKDFTKSSKSHSEKQIATTIRKLALGLEEAHKIGVVHRDLKPANVMVDLKGEPVVMDFGLARRSRSDDVKVTQSGAILGTPAYMAPEQVAGDQAAIDHRVDIYALGVIMYELITGEMPFKGNLMALLQQISLNNPRKPSELRKEIDPRLEKICLKMMAGDQTQRYQSMKEVATALQDVLRTPRKSQKKKPRTPSETKTAAFPSRQDESNPALITLDQQPSIAEQLRQKRGKVPKKTQSKHRTGSRFGAAGPVNSVYLASGIGGLLLLLGIIFLVRVGKYDVQITLEDPGITLSVDGETLNINNGSDVIKLKAGAHKLQLEKDGLTTHVEEFTVTKDGKTALTAKVVNGKLDALLNGEETPHAAATSPPATSELKNTARLVWSADTPPPAVAPFDKEQATAHQQAWASYLGVPVERDISLPGGEKLTMVLIPPGEFFMGSPDEQQARLREAAQAANNDWAMHMVSHEGPHHKVRITKPFYLGKYEVTQAQWQSVMGSIPVQSRNGFEHPVEWVSWNDIQRFLAKLNESGRVKKMTFLLPTEAQWEYACRAGTNTLYHSGDREDDLRQFGWSAENSGGRTQPVGKLEPNAFDLHDMHGNVWEWCADWRADDDYESSTGEDPSGPSSGTNRIFRGGSWLHPALVCRSGFRSNQFPDGLGPDIGFRLAASLDDAARASFPASIVAGDATGSSILSAMAPLTTPSRERTVLETSLYFSRLEDEVVIPTLMDDTDALTMEVWLQRDSTHLTAHSQILSFGKTTGINVNSTSGLDFQMPTTVGEDGPREGWNVYGVGQPIHIAGVRDPGKKEIRLYYDGKLIQTSPGEIRRGEGTLQIASKEYQWIGTDGDYHFSGWIDEVRISKSVRYQEDFTPPRRFDKDADTVALYHFEEAAGAVLKDSSGNGHDGSIVGAKWVNSSDHVAAPLLRQESLSYALQFDGSHDYVEIPSLKIDSSKPLTFEAWCLISPDKPVEEEYLDPLFVTNTLTDQQLGYVLIQDRKNKGYWMADQSLQDNHASSNHLYIKGLSLVEMHHVAAVWTASEKRLYVDGKLVAQGAAPLASFDTDFNDSERFPTIGRSLLLHKPMERYLRGMISEIRISRSARYDRDFIPIERFNSDDNTVALYHFDEGNGAVLKDSSGNGHDGRIVGAKWVTPAAAALPPTVAPSEDARP